MKTLILTLIASFICLGAIDEANAGAASKWFYAADNCDAGSLERTLKENGDLLTVNSYGYRKQTALHHIALSNEPAFKCKKAAQFLIDEGANVNAKNRKLQTPLYMSTKENKLPLVKFFVENGANVNIRSKSGISPIWFAILKNNLELVKLLVENGAHLITWESYDTPLQISKELGRDEISRYLIQEMERQNCKWGWCWNRP